jgi:hypothetical protein
MRCRRTDGGNHQSLLRTFLRTGLRFRTFRLLRSRINDDRLYPRMMMMPMHDRPADCRYRLDRRMGANNRMGTNNRIDANDWSDANNRRNVNRGHANDRGWGDADNRGDISAGHRRCRDQQQCGRGDFSHGLVVTPMCTAASSSRRGRRRSRVLVSAMSVGEDRDPTGSAGVGAYHGLMGLFPGDAAIHRE